MIIVFSKIYDVFFLLITCKNDTREKLSIAASILRRFINKFFLGKKEPFFLKKEIVLKTSYGKYLLEKSNYNVLLIARYLRMKKMFNDIKSGDVLDVGANIGLTAIPFGLLLLEKYNSKHKVYAFEPSPKSFSLLKKNIELNKLKNIVYAYNFALSDISGTTKFIEYQEAHGLSHLVDSQEEFDEINIQAKVIEVHKSTIDEWYSSSGINISKVSILKIDVENHELNVLRGAIKFINETEIQRIICEIWDNKSFIKREIDNFLSNFNYTLKMKIGDNYFYEKNSNIHK